MVRHLSRCERRLRQLIRLEFSHYKKGEHKSREQALRIAFEKFRQQHKKKGIKCPAKLMRKP